MRGTEEYQELQRIAKEYAELKGTYQEYYERISKVYDGIDNINIDNEITSDIIGDYLFSDKEFIDKMYIENRNLFIKIKDKIKSWIKMATFGSKEYKKLVELQNKFEEVYKAGKQSKSNGNIQYSIQKDSNENQYVKVDTDQDIFEGVDVKDYNKIAKMYIQDYLIGETFLTNDGVVIIDSKSASKYTNPGKKQNYFNEKMKLTPELKNVLNIAQKVSEGNPSKINSKYSSWEYYNFSFEINGERFQGTINIGIDSNGNKHFYEVNKIKRVADILETSPNRSTTSYKYSIPNSNEKSNTNIKYSMQKEEKMQKTK